MLYSCTRMATVDVKGLKKHTQAIVDELKRTNQRWPWVQIS